MPVTSSVPTRVPTPAPELRRARWAVAALFLTNGALLANILPRYPEIKAALDMPSSTYGLALATFPTGAILAGLAAGSAVRRFGSGRVAAAGTLLTSIGLLLAGLAPAPILFAAALLLAGACDAITDVGQNSHGLRVQRRYGRSILNSFHATWSIGAVIGGSMAAVAIALDLPLPVHLGISAVLFTVVALVALRFCLPGHDEVVAEDAPHAVAAAGGRVAPSRTVLMAAALVIIAIAGTVVEDAGNSWATLYLGQGLGAPAAIAATGYIALVGAQFIGRLVGDRLVDRFGQRRVARAGGLVIALGMGLALAWPTIPGTILGFAAAGLGSATLVPAAMGEADELPGLRPGTGLTVVSWLMRIGFLVSPPIVGLVADAAGLRAGLLLVPLAGLGVVLFAGVLRTRATGPTSGAGPASAAGPGTAPEPGTDPEPAAGRTDPALSALR